MELKSDSCLVLFLDILGYKKWVEMHSSEEAYELFKKLYLESIRFLEGISKYVPELKSAIHQLLVADSIIFYLELTENSSYANHVGIFFQYIAAFITDFIANTGLMLRGGLTYGDVDIRNIEGSDNLFVFSKAHNIATSLEKDAEFPRVLVEPHLAEMCNDFFRDGELAKGFVKNTWGDYYFDYYYFLEKYLPFQNAKEILRKIKNNVGNAFHAIDPTKLDRKLKQKYYYFRDYHNNAIRTIFRPRLLDQDFQELNIDKFDSLMALRGTGIVIEGNDGEHILSIEPDEILKRWHLIEPQYSNNPALLTRIRQRINENKVEIQQFTISLR